MPDSLHHAEERKPVSDKVLMCHVKGFRAGILQGNPSTMMCFAVCSALHGYLAWIGVHSELFESDLGELNHVWLKLQDGRVLDPTSDQFNELFPHKKYPVIYLGTPLDIHDNAKPYAR